MQRQLTQRKLSEEEEIKAAGLVLDFDEIAKRGSMSKEEGLIAKWHGVYGSRQSGDLMARIVVPGGILTSVQARQIADTAARHAQGLINITTRQSIQYHKLRVGTLPQVLRELASEGISTYHGCGDVNRNTTACHMAENCAHASFDVRPYARETSRYLAACHDLDNLPRKLKIVFSGCRAACAQPYLNCLGLTAVLDRVGGRDLPGFQAVIGGGMGWKAFVAQELFSFVPEDRVVRLTRAVALLFRDHGDRFNRARSRLKFVVDRLGIDRCRELVLEHLRAEGVSVDGFRTDPLPDTALPIPCRPLTDSALKTADGSAVVRIRVPRGEIDPGQLTAIANLADRYADQRLYTTNRQNIELHGIAAEKRDEVRKCVEELGFQTGGTEGLLDIVPCVGTKYCPKAVGTTHDLHDRLQPLVQNEKYASIREAVRINITGCPNSCSPYRIADIGFRGMRIREAQGSVEGWEMLIGGDQKAHGRKLGEFKTEDCIAVTAAVLDIFLASRAGTETLTDCVVRLGIEPFRKAVAGRFDYAMAPAPREYSVSEGKAATDGDRRVIAKDIPCQAACPALTNVPRYIEHLARGNADACYAVNLECNVFPGVLGRVCTRPCEDRCRHQWTNTRGPVTICHLKRAGADSASGAVPPPPHFGPTGKRAAVVGGGPAGLAAARELKRMGHEVTLFEREDRLGGMMVDGIPKFRLPREVVDREIDLITGTGIAVKTGINVDAERLREIAASHDALCIATGTTKVNPLEIPGIPSGLMISGLDFMRRYNRGEITSLEGDVVVVGGGFTAVDCARSSARAARRLLGDGGEVSIFYRRTERFMAANPEEIEELSRERISIRTLVTPVRGRLQDGRVAAVTFQRNVLAADKEGAKPRMLPVPGSEFEVPCRHLIAAIGQERDLAILPPGLSLAGGFRTSEAGVFVTGDFATGSDNVIKAVANGKAVAREMDAFLMGRQRLQTVVAIEDLDLDGYAGRVRDHDLLEPAPMGLAELAARAAGDAEVETGFSAQGALNNAKRCYLCHYKFEIDQDRCIHCDWCIDAAPRKCIKRVASVRTDAEGRAVAVGETQDAAAATFIWIDSDQCIRCGKCLRACPSGAISMRRAELQECACAAGTAP